jgi:hypothetical protein
MTSLQHIRALLQNLATDLRSEPDAQAILWEAVDGLVDIEVALVAANEQLKEFVRKYECPDIRLES